MDDEYGMSTDKARQRLRFQVTGGDFELMASAGGGGRTGRETASSVAADVRRFLHGKGLRKLDVERLRLILRSPNWRPFLRSDLSSTSKSMLVFGDCNDGKHPSYWLLAPDKAKHWRLSRVTTSDLPKPTGLDLLFLPAAEMRSGSPAQIRAFAADLAHRWSATDLPLDEQIAWASIADAPDVLQPWEEAGIALKNAHTWLSEGFNPETARPWVAERFDAYAARNWHNAGLDPQGAKKWTVHHIPAHAAVEFRAIGLTPLQGANWFTSIRNVEAIVGWVSRGFTTSEALAWESLGPARATAIRDGHSKLTDSEAMALKLAGRQPPGADRHGGTAATRRDTGELSEQPSERVEPNTAPPTRTTSSGPRPVTPSDDHQAQPPMAAPGVPPLESQHRHDDIEKAGTVEAPESTGPQHRFEAELSSLTAAYAHLAAEHAALRAQHAELSAAMTSTGELLTTAERRRTDLEAERDRLASDLHAHEHNAEITAQLLAGAQQARENAQRELTTLNQELMEVAAALHSSETTVGHLHEEVARTTSEVDTLQAQNARAQERVAQLSEQLIEVHRAKDKMHDELTVEITDLQERLRHLERLAPKRLLRRAARQ